MTKYAISASALTNVAVALNAIADELTPDAIVLDRAQPELPFDGEAQACEAFVEEREQLKASLDWYEDCLRKARAELAQVNEVLPKVAAYATALQASLNGIGIAYVPGEDGLPQIAIHIPTLAQALEAYAAG